MPLILDPSINNNLNIFFSNIIKTDKPVIVGIDEAGRGPVIGPLVYGMYVGYKNNTQFKDSKLLTVNQRNYFYEYIKKCKDDVAGYAYIKIHPSFITSHMEGNLNLNEISRMGVIKLLTELQNKCSNVTCIYIDGLGNNETYKEDLSKYFSFNFIIENKADLKYPCVSAASIVAKVNRDISVPLEYGSGYPSDPVTKKWLSKNKKLFFGFPSFVRHSWQTIKTLLGEKKSFKLKNELEGFYISDE